VAERTWFNEGYSCKNQTINPSPVNMIKSSSCVAASTQTTKMGGCEHTGLERSGGWSTLREDIGLRYCYLTVQVVY
jgi:hypothetical protein